MEGTIIIPDTHVFYIFDPELKPVTRVKPGSRVVLYTKDALGGQITSENQVVTNIDFTKINPATGPVYIEGAEPGDALKVKILSITLGEKGFVVVAPGAGALPYLTKQAKTRKCIVHGDLVEFLDYKIPARKMIGVIGVASSEKLTTGVPGRHGGNLDTRFITEGATVILPIEYPGGLFGLGDLHAVMGDGEVCVSACEVPGKVELMFDIIKNKAPLWPIVELGDSTYILVSHEDLNKAVNEAVETAVNTLSRGLSLDWYDAYMLASLSIDIGISQLVDPRKTVYIRIPKNILSLDKLLEALSKQ